MFGQSNYANKCDNNDLSGNSNSNNQKDSIKRIELN